VTDYGWQALSNRHSPLGNPQTAERGPHLRAEVTDRGAGCGADRHNLTRELRPDWRLVVTLCERRHLGGAGVAGLRDCAAESGLTPPVGGEPARGQLRQQRGGPTHCVILPGGWDHPC
jgi:hypothetical protein